MKTAFLSPFSSSVLYEYIPQLKAQNVPAGMGGSAVFELVKGLIESGIEIYILTLHPGLKEIKEYHSNNVHYYIIPRRLNGSIRDLWRSEQRLIKDVLNKIKPDIVHANWTYEYALAALDYDIDKTIITVHDIPIKVLKYSSIYYFPLFLTSYYVYSKSKTMVFVSNR